MPLFLVYEVFISENRCWISSNVFPTSIWNELTVFLPQPSPTMNQMKRFSNMELPIVFWNKLYFVKCYSPNMLLCLICYVIMSIYISIQKQNWPILFFYVIFVTIWTVLIKWNVKLFIFSYTQREHKNNPFLQDLLKLAIKPTKLCAFWGRDWG